jgi:sialate O-acetylesterase
MQPVGRHNLTYASTLPEPVKGGHIKLNPFHVFSATCMYFGVGVTDELGSEAPAIGLIQSAVGGTQIEAWLDNSTLKTCGNESGYKWNTSTTPPTFDGYPLTSKLFYGMVSPFVNMTINGWLWYQGENNCHGDMGNSVTKTGYGCEQVALVNLWRQVWSAASSTSPHAPFGLVTLAAGGSEGAGYVRVPTGQQCPSTATSPQPYKLVVPGANPPPLD